MKKTMIGLFILISSISFSASITDIDVDYFGMYKDSVLDSNTKELKSVIINTDTNDLYLINESETIGLNKVRNNIRAIPSNVFYYHFMFNYNGVKQSGYIRSVDYKSVSDIETEIKNNPESYLISYDVSGIND